MVERSASRFLAQGHLDGRRVGEIDVQPAIAIVIPQNDAAAHRLDNVCAQWIGDMAETDTCLLPDVLCTEPSWRSAAEEARPDAAPDSKPSVQAAPLRRRAGRECKVMVADSIAVRRAQVHGFLSSFFCGTCPGTVVPSSRRTARAASSAGASASAFRNARIASGWFPAR